MTLNDLANKHGTDKGDGNYDRHDYARIYEPLIEACGRLHVNPITPMRMLEIGVWDPRNPGASVRMWRAYDPAFEIHGLDVNPDCAAALEAECSAIIHLGNQGDEAFMAKLAESLPGLDFVIDDGSHVASHQRVSFEALFARVLPGGFYAIEDCHASCSLSRGAAEHMMNQRGLNILSHDNPKLAIGLRP
jgi:hypothetical protein